MDNSDQKRSSPSSAPLPGRLWVFDHNKLREGDVVLEFGEGFKSRVISRLDGSPFSHALIWVGNTDFVESVRSGVRILSFERVVIADPKHWTLLRQSNRQVGKRAAAAARRMVGKYYNAAGAVTSLSPALGFADPEQLFCSELIAQAYLDAGVELAPGRAPHKVTPRMLLESTFFSSITPPILECDDRNRERLISGLDRDAAHTDSIMADESRVARTAFELVAPLLPTLNEVNGELAKNRPGNLHELLDVLASHPHSASQLLLDRLLMALSELGYFALLDDPLAQTKETFTSAGMHLRFGNMDPIERNHLRQDMLAQARAFGETAKRYLNNALVCEQVCQSAPHGLWKGLASMHRRNYMQLQILRAIVADTCSDV